MKVAVLNKYSTAGETRRFTRTGEDGGSGTGKTGHSTRTKRKHKTATRKRQHGELRFIAGGISVQWRIQRGFDGLRQTPQPGNLGFIEPLICLLASYSAYLLGRFLVNI